MWCKEEKSGNPFSESHFSPGQTGEITQPSRTPEQLHKARAARSVAFPHDRKVSILPARLPSRNVCLSFRSQPQTGSGGSLPIKARGGSRSPLVALECKLPRVRHLEAN